MNKSIEKIPVWAMCYIVNGDATGLTDEDIALVDNWYKKNNVQTVTFADENAEPYFSHYPAFGLGSDVYDCIVVMN